MKLVVMCYDDHEYEGPQAPGTFIAEAKSLRDLPCLKTEKGCAYFAYEMKERGVVYTFEVRYPNAYTAFGRYGARVCGWWHDDVLVKEFSRVPWGEQSVELPPGYSHLWQDSDGAIHLVSDAEYDRLRSEWQSKHPQPQSFGTMTAWWGSESFNSYVNRRLAMTRMKSADE